MLPALHPRVFRGLLAAGLAFLVAAAAMTSYACHASTPTALLAEGADTLDAKSDACEEGLSWQAVLPGSGAVPRPAAYAHRVAEDLVELSSALADTHPQRGPPSRS